MTPVRLPLRSISYLPQVHPAFDPPLEDENAWLPCPPLFIRAPETSRLGWASRQGSAIHWYRELHDRRLIETG